MMIIIDASVAAKWVLPEPDSDRAAGLRKHEDDFAAPSLVIAEVGNAIWKRAIRGEISKTDAAAALETVMAHFAEVVSLDELAARAIQFAIDLRHPIYDCFYLALAERERAPIVSADVRLLAAAGRVPSIAARKL
ncbi:MAG TPA: type II toxin-antitoxin system VapC family toxin [Xanthobacteraceae bacterium]|jgi:predicted nucleic acid-binding protein